MNLASSLKDIAVYQAGDFSFLTGDILKIRQNAISTQGSAANNAIYTQE